MRRNVRRSKRMSVMTSRSLHIGAVIMMFFAMVILNLLANSSCTQITKEIGQKHRVLAQLEEELASETARWDAMITSEKLTQMLPRCGLAMDYPREDQIVRMNAAGRPYAGQLSVAMLHKSASVKVGKVSPPPAASRRRRRR